MISTTGTTIESYLKWVKEEIEKKKYGEVSINFIVNNSQIVDVKKVSMDSEHFPLKKN